MLVLPPETERLEAMEAAEGWPMVLVAIVAAIVIHVLLLEAKREIAEARLKRRQYEEASKV